MEWKRREGNDPRPKPPCSPGAGCAVTAESWEAKKRRLAERLSKVIGPQP